MSQTDQILAALEAGDSLTPMDALRRFGCMRLGARIWDLQQRGHRIESEIVSEGGKKFARYRLAREPRTVRIGDSEQCCLL